MSVSSSFSQSVPSDNKSSRKGCSVSQLLWLQQKETEKEKESFTFIPSYIGIHPQRTSLWKRPVQMGSTSHRGFLLLRLHQATFCYFYHLCLLIIYLSNVQGGGRSCVSLQRPPYAAACNSPQLQLTHPSGNTEIRRRSCADKRSSFRVAERLSEMKKKL